MKGSIHGPESVVNFPESKVQQLTAPRADEGRQENPPVLSEGSDAGPRKKAVNLPYAVYNNRTTTPLSPADVNWRCYLHYLCYCSSKVGVDLEKDDLHLIDSMLADERTMALFNLQKQRDIVRREGTTLSLDTLDRVQAFLIQITGRESMFPCFECLRKRGPFVGCILDIGPGDSLWVRPCGNCVYLGSPCGTSSRATQPDNNTGPKKHSLAPAQRSHDIPSVLDTRSTKAVPMQPNPAPPQGSHKIPSGLGTSLTNTTTRTHQTNIISQATHGSPTPPLPEPRHTEVPQALLVSSSNSVPRTITPLATGPQPLNVTSDDSATHLLQDVILPQSGVSETEPWEEAPGRIRSSTCSVPNSKSLCDVLCSPFVSYKYSPTSLTTDIAFSRSYLSTVEPVRVCKEATHWVRRITHGMIFTLEKSENTIRLCTVATGKLHVQLDEEPIFVIGTHGLFKINPGVACTIANEMDLDAMLHITSIFLDA